jgi:hypothetical protein
MHGTKKKKKKKLYSGVEFEGDLSASRDGLNEEEEEEEEEDEEEVEEEEEDEEDEGGNRARGEFNPAACT